MIADRSAPPPEPPSEPPAPGARVRDIGASRLWRAVIRSVRVAVIGGFVGVALMGAVVTPLIAMLVVAPVTGCAMGLMVALLNPAFPAELWARRGVLLTAATGAAFVPFTRGLNLLGYAGGVVALVLLVLFSLLAANWIMGAIEPAAAGAEPRDEHWERVILPSLTTAALLREWRATQQVFGSRTGIADQARAVQIRGLLLEEFARRDPAAVERWLTNGDWSSEPSIRPDRDVAG